MVQNVKIVNKSLYHTQNFVSICLSTVFLVSFCAGNDIIFHSEKIVFEIHENYCRVSANYTFRNDFQKDIQRILYYPFPDNKNLPFPCSIMVTAENGDLIEYKNNQNGITFPIRIPPNNTQCCTVIYEQATSDQFFEYILNTTMDWHFPLTSVEFIIVVPDNISIDDISLSDYKITREDDKTRYRIYRENFRSDENLLIQWRLK
ncbi:MAG: hypothetical protein ABIK30_05545 [bacterium]